MDRIGFFLMIIFDWKSILGYESGEFFSEMWEGRWWKSKKKNI